MNENATYSADVCTKMKTDGFNSQLVVFFEWCHRVIHQAFWRGRHHLLAPCEHSVTLPWNCTWPGSCQKKETIIIRTLTFQVFFFPNQLANPNMLLSFIVSHSFCGDFFHWYNPLFWGEFLLVQDFHPTSTGSTGCHLSIHVNGGISLQVTPSRRVERVVLNHWAGRKWLFLYMCFRSKKNTCWN